jgi:hypothetical protein
MRQIIVTKQLGVIVPELRYYRFYQVAKAQDSADTADLTA